MSAPPYMKLYIADYHVETTEFDVIGHGAYLLLLMAMWRAGGKLPREPEKLRRLAKCSPEQWDTISAEVLDHFKVSGGSLTHARVKKEIGKYNAIVKGSKEGGETTQARKRNKVKEEATNVPSDSIEGDANQPEPKPEPYLVGGSVVALREASPKSEKPEVQPDWPENPRVLNDLHAVAGPGLADRAKTPSLVATSGVIVSWRQGGCSWLQDVLPTVTALTAKARGDPINTWAYFTPAVTRARDMRLTALPPPQLVTENGHATSARAARTAERYESYGNANAAIAELARERERGRD